MGTTAVVILQAAPASSPSASPIQALSITGARVENVMMIPQKAKAIPTHSVEFVGFLLGIALRVWECLVNPGKNLQLTFQCRRRAVMKEVRGIGPVLDPARSDLGGRHHYVRHFSGPRRR